MNIIALCLFSSQLFLMLVVTIFGAYTHGDISLFRFSNYSAITMLTAGSFVTIILFLVRRQYGKRYTVPAMISVLFWTFAFITVFVHHLTWWKGGMETVICLFASATAVAAVMAVAFILKAYGLMILPWLVVAFAIQVFTQHHAIFAPFKIGPGATIVIGLIASLALYVAAYVFHPSILRPNHYPTRLGKKR